MANDGRVLRRYVLIAGAVTVVAFAGWGVVRHFAGAPPGDYAVRQGDILLGDGKFAEAIDRFDAALAANPRHAGAMMGRAVALLQTGRGDEAEAAFTALIAFLEKTETTDEAGRRRALAVAFANRGILHDRAGRPEKALADYRRALAINAGMVAGPGLVDRVLYGTPDPATVAKRADYLERQLRLPPAERILRRPEIDSRQRMVKP